MILTRPFLICIHCGTGPKACGSEVSHVHCGTGVSPVLWKQLKKERSPLTQKVRSPLSIPNQGLLNKLGKIAIAINGQFKLGKT
ncbi:hypothetical protein [Oscillatoria nigro-viridis]|uniref:hypothetical protein n=1 Tax=Phormidium nigroviride TaxID=482564 RepID=UPI0012371B82